VNDSQTLVKDTAERKKIQIPCSPLPFVGGVLTPPQKPGRFLISSLRPCLANNLCRPRFLSEDNNPLWWLPFGGFS
jgi:hypothetical protein